MIEFKEGAVFYANGFSWFADMDYSDDVINIRDFQLNTIKQGDCISKSELDTEGKYNLAVEVFGLFGFKVPELEFYSDLNEVTNQLAVWEGEIVVSYDNERKITFNQLMAIGELKRKMDEPQFGKNKDGSMKLLKNNFSDVGDNKVDNKSESAFNRIKMAELEKCKADFEINKILDSNKSKQAYDILKSMGIEYDLVKQQWYKKQYI